MVTNQFNGRVYLAQSVKRDGFFDITLAFTDFTSYYRGIDALIGDVVFLRGQDGKGYRLVVTAFQRKLASQITCTVSTDTPLSILPPQYCAIVRETPNRKFPMFPIGLPLAIRSIMENYYAVIDDSLPIGVGGCTGDLITHTQVQGTETICLQKADGSQAKITIDELREYILIMTNSTDEKYRLGVGFMGAMANTQVNQ